MTDAPVLKIPPATGAVAQCRGCGGLLFANVFHICAFNMNLHEGSFSQEELTRLIAASYVPAPPPSNEAGIVTEPPLLMVSNSRTHCDACLEALDPNAMHVCAGNK
jgi:hypothetical protein